jgi:hypothetical protein
MADRHALLLSQQALLDDLAILNDAYTQSLWP